MQIGSPYPCTLQRTRKVSLLLDSRLAASAQLTLGLAENYPPSSPQWHSLPPECQKAVMLLLSGMIARAIAKEVPDDENS